MQRPSPAMLVALIALFIALGGTSIAALKLKANSVGSKQIKPDAATGADVSESTFSKVPSAVNADNAANAANAAKANDALHAASSDAVGGFTANDFVLGAGSQFAFSVTIPDGQNDGLTFGGTDELFVNCAASPTLTWENDFNDPGAPVTHVFRDGAHFPVVDGAVITPLGNLADGSHDIEVSTGDGLVISARIGVFRDTVPNPDNCKVSVFANIEPDAAGITSADRSRQNRPKPGIAG